MNGSEDWKSGCLLGGILIWGWGWRWVVRLRFWLRCLRACGWVCYLQRCWRIGDCWLWCMDLACVWHIDVWLVVLRRISVVVGLVFWARVEVMMRRLIQG
jgi:hypothetical protein